MSKKGNNKYTNPLSNHPGPNYPHKVEPWQDESGDTHSTERLKKESRTWDADTWERYLKTMEAPQAEMLTEDYDELLHQHDVREALQLFYGEAGPKIQISAETLSRAMTKLSPNQQTILRRHFWQGQSFEDIGRELGKTKAAIWNSCERALEALKKEFLREKT